METQKETKQAAKNIDLVNELNKYNKYVNVSKTIKNKYIYPKHLQDKKSTDKEKKNYRKNIQKKILTFLSFDEPTKEIKKDFEKFCKTFINSFESLNNCEIDNLYSFHNEKQKNDANNILKKYKQIK